MIYSIQERKQVRISFHFNPDIILVAFKAGVGLRVKQVYYFTDTRLLITKGYENKSNKKTHHIKLEMLWDLPIPAFAYEVGIFIEPDPDRYNSPRGEMIQRYKTDVARHHRGDP